MGGPAQSFAAIERMLQAACNRLQMANMAATSTAAAAASTAPPSGGSTPAPSRPTATAAANSSLPTLAKPPNSSGFRSAAAAAAPSGQLPPPDQQLQRLRESTWLLLEMVGALERALHHAYEGGRGQSQLSSGVLAFFAANRSGSSLCGVIDV